MKTKAILLAVLFSFSMVLSSCNKEDDPKPKSTDDVEYPVNGVEEDTPNS